MATTTEDTVTELLFPASLSSPGPPGPQLQGSVARSSCFLTELGLKGRETGSGQASPWPRAHRASSSPREVRGFLPQPLHVATGDGDVESQGSGRYGHLWPSGWCLGHWTQCQVGVMWLLTLFSALGLAPLSSGLPTTLGFRARSAFQTLTRQVLVVPGGNRGWC